MRFSAVICAAVAVLLAGAASAGAQGAGRHGPPSVPPGQSKKPAPTTTTGAVPSAGTSPASTTTPSAGDIGGAGRTRLQTFGTWLDTADVNAPGEAWMSLSTSYWRSDSLREVDAPSMGLSLGVAPRVQLGLSLPYYHATDRSGVTSHGFGASYLTSKIALASGARVRASISPTLEILNYSSPDTGIHRLNWILPVSLQADSGSTRMYATAGYVSRGSVFGSGALEWSATPRLTLVATASHSYSVASDPVSDALGITRHRTDASGGAYVTISPSLVLFTSAGRTVAPVDASSSRLSLSAGIAVNVAGPSTASPRLP